MAHSLSLCILGQSPHQLWGLSLTGRLLRQFSRAGCSTVLEESKLSSARGAVILVRADAVLDMPLIDTLCNSPGLLLLSGDPDPDKPLAAHVMAERVGEMASVLRGDTPATAMTGMSVNRPDQLEDRYWQALRKREIPYAFRYDPARRDEIEWRSFMGTYKGATDLVTKHVWPRPAFWLTRLLAPTFITPNMVTAVSAIFTVLAFILFWQGHWVAGLICAWLMTYLDTVDGKLARTTLTASKWGNVFDHGIDLVHPPFWYWAWGVGLATTAHPLDSATLTLVLGVIIGGYVLQRLIEGAAIAWLGIEIHIWRPIDSLFRQVTARRNPNLILLSLSVLFGRPDWGLVAVAVWTALCLVLHGLQFLQAAMIRRRGGKLQSWLAKPGP